MPNENLTAIFELIDGSGSMDTMKKAVVDGTHEFLMDQKKLPGTVVFSMAQFNSSWPTNTQEFYSQHMTYTKLVHFKNIQEIDKNILSSYTPNGGTPLLEAMHTAIEEFGKDLAAMPEKERPSKIIFMVITDGEENSSNRMYSKEKIATMVKQQTTIYNWQFVFMGANIDSFAEADKVGISSINTMNFNNTYKGMTTAYSSVSESLCSYRVGATGTVDLSKVLKDDTK